jgi:hypothetical protein
MIAFSSTFNWLGKWNVTSGCAYSNCCCPSVGTSVQFTQNPNNASQLFVRGNWSNSAGSYYNICGYINQGANTTYTFPWGQNAANFSYYYDSYGFEYQVEVYNSTNTTYAVIDMDEYSQYGSSYCTFTIYDTEVQPNNNLNWTGIWNVTSGCDPNHCCCPQTNSSLVIAQNQWNTNDLILTANWTKNTVCNNIHASSGIPYFLPWSKTQGNFTFNDHIEDNYGINYQGIISKVNNRTQAAILSQQTIQGGNDLCSYTLALHSMSGSNNELLNEYISN